MSNSEAKTKPASARKLRKLRTDGSVAQASDATGFLGAAAGTVAILILVGSVAAGLTQIFDVAIAAAELPFDEALRAAPKEIGRRVVLLVAPIAAASLIVSVIVTIIYNGGIIFAIKPVVPQMERVSPLAGLKRVYGRRGWIETGATALRLTLWLGFAALVGWLWLPGFAGAAQCGLPCQARLAIPPAWLIGVGFAVILILSAGTDMLVQKSLFEFEQMMTESEVKQERKEAFGDPGIRKERRRRQREEPPDPKAIGLSRANMCFFDETGAVAIRYHPQMARIPRICHKGSGFEAHEMRRTMGEAGMAVVESAEIVRGCRGIAPGGAMAADLYEPFAKALKKGLT